MEFEELMARFPHYRKGDVLLLHADCMDVMSMMPDKAVDLAVVDPPYGIGDTFIDYSSGKVKGKLERIHKKMEWDNLIPTKEYFKELKKISEKQIIWGANYFNCFDNGGSLVWYKNRGGNTLSQCEIASISGQIKVDYVSIQILTGFVSNENRIHPTQKPIALYKWLYANYAKPNQLIFDSHGGSFSSAIAAHYSGMRFIGCELDKDYYRAAVERFKQATAQTDILMEYS